MPSAGPESEARRKIAAAAKIERQDPGRAAVLYRDAVQLLKQMDRLDQREPLHRSRRQRLPVNKLTLALERCGRWTECLRVIERYERSTDPRGISKSDRDSLRRRKQRMLRKTNAGRTGSAAAS
jgi:hypothetical protein